eukprot:Gb_04860 [translate_table: standard]
MYLEAQELNKYPLVVSSTYGNISGLFSSAEMDPCVASNKADAQESADSPMAPFCAKVAGASSGAVSELGFEKVEEQFVEEYKSTAVLYRHKKTDAEVMSLSNDDENKVFGIVFRTPPQLAILIFFPSCVIFQMRLLGKFSKWIVDPFNASLGVLPSECTWHNLFSVSLGCKHKSGQ